MFYYIIIVRHLNYVSSIFPNILYHYIICSGLAIYILGFPFSKVETTVQTLPFYDLKLKGYKFAARLSQFSNKNTDCHDRTRQL